MLLTTRMNAALVLSKVPASLLADEQAAAVTTAAAAPGTSWFSL
jgi:outer membrane receptor protein involved in Fe transport